MKRPPSTRRSLASLLSLSAPWFLRLGLTLLLVCGASEGVVAQDDRVAALEARITELESLVHQLMHEHRPPIDAAEIEDMAEEAAAAAAEAKTTDLLVAHHEEEDEMARRHSYKFGGGERIGADDSRLPDLVARYSLARDWGNFTAAGLYRELRIDDATAGCGLSLPGVVNVGARDDFRWMLSAGRGLGRYIGLNTADGAVLDADHRLHAVDSAGWFGSYRHYWNARWRSNLTLGYLAVDNDLVLTGTDATREACSLHLNLFYSLWPQVDFGTEVLYAERESEAGDLVRLQFSAKYAYWGGRALN